MGCREEMSLRIKGDGRKHGLIRRAVHEPSTQTTDERDKSKK